MRRVRLDQLLVRKGSFVSRARARRAIVEGEVWIEGVCADKPGRRVPEDIRWSILPRGARYVSRGGEKLFAALARWSPLLAGEVALDVGASTGGFTDCLLQQGVFLVYAVDVGHGQLAERLRRDPRVVVRERCHIARMTRGELGGRLPSVVTMDVSFIAAAPLLSHIRTLVDEGARLLLLVKPQFEAAHAEVGKQGVVRDPSVHRRVLQKTVRMAHAACWDPLDCMLSPLRGAKGNVEFFWYMRAAASPRYRDWGEVIDAVVRQVP
ncbi:TlyA family RNA methyltransferase [Pasteuria penetrans]|uniref:TlyA family RNA methyltransferase n=1 Tax=Pasteuria penetrans TaxID=86005 RepID=UPI000F926DBC|nr:TlyA family RNA methyltransferase [Pasteuria penetrans]